MVLGRLMLMAGVVVLAYGLTLAGTAMPWLGVGILCFLAYLIKNSHKRLTTLGSAKWADADDLGKAGMLTAKSGLILGRLTVTRRDSSRPSGRSLACGSMRCRRAGSS